MGEVGDEIIMKLQGNKRQRLSLYIKSKGTEKGLRSFALC